MTEARALISRAALLYLIHLASMMSIPFVIADIAFGTPFVLPAMITACVVAAVSYIWGAITASDATDVLTHSSRKSITFQRMFHGIYAFIVGLWLLIPMCYFTTAHTTLAIVIASVTGAFYLASFVLSLCLDANRY